MVKNAGFETTKITTGPGPWLKAESHVDENAVAVVKTVSHAMISPAGQIPFAPGNAKPAVSPKTAQQR